MTLEKYKILLKKYFLFLFSYKTFLKICSVKDPFFFFFFPSFINTIKAYGMEVEKETSQVSWSVVNDRERCIAFDF